jgi:hypothetical protein
MSGIIANAIAKHPEYSGVFLATRSRVSSLMQQMTRNGVERFVTRLTMLFGEDVSRVFYLERNVIGALVGNALFIRMDASHVIPRPEYGSSNRVVERAFSLDMYEAITGIKVVGKIPPKDLRVTIGADPEFLCYSTKISNKKRVPRYKERLINVNDIVGNTIGDSACPLGTDGCSTVGEARPKYATTAKELTDNLEQIVVALERRLDMQKRRDIHVETGGGFEYSIGGHIHLGNLLLLSMLDNKMLDQLGMMLDDFLYFPMKLNKPGAMRKWSECDEISKILTWSNSGEIRYTYPDSTEDIQDAVKKGKPNRKHVRYDEYEQDKCFRGQSWGIEYRSLPSFICDKTFSHLVFKLAQKIAEKFLACINGETFEYNHEPTKEDYLRFITEEEYSQWYEYIYGKKQDSFLVDALTQWNVRGKETMFLRLTDETTHAGYGQDYARFEFLEKMYTRLNPVAQHILQVHTPMKKPINLGIMSSDYWLDESPNPLIITRHGIGACFLPERRSMQHGIERFGTSEYDAIAYYNSSMPTSLRKLSAMIWKLLDYLILFELPPHKQGEALELLKKAFPSYPSYFKNMLRFSKDSLIEVSTPAPTMERSTDGTNIPRSSTISSDTRWRIG